MRRFLPTLLSICRQLWLLLCDMILDIRLWWMDSSIELLLDQQERMRRDLIDLYQERSHFIQKRIQGWRP